SSLALLVLAVESLLPTSKATAQEALPMGRTIGDACTRSVTLPAPTQGPALRPGAPGGAGPAGAGGPGGGAGPAGGFFPAPPAAGPEEPTRLVKVRDDVYAIVNVNDA